MGELGTVLKRCGFPGTQKPPANSSATGGGVDANCGQQRARHIGRRSPISDGTNHPQSLRRVGENKRHGAEAQRHPTPPNQVSKKRFWVQRTYCDTNDVSTSGCLDGDGVGAVNKLGIEHPKYLRSQFRQEELRKTSDVQRHNFIEIHCLDFRNQMVIGWISTMRHIRQVFLKYTLAILLIRTSSMRTQGSMRS